MPPTDFVLMRRQLTAADVARAIPIAAVTVAADERAAAALAASFTIRAAAVEALLHIDATTDPDDALRLVGLQGDVDALRVGHAMSGATWDPMLVRVLASILKPLLPSSPATHSVARRDPPADLTAALMGDPSTARSAYAERRAA